MGMRVVVYLFFPEGKSGMHCWAVSARNASNVSLVTVSEANSVMYQTHISGNGKSDGAILSSLVMNHSSDRLAV